MLEVVKTDFRPLGVIFQLETRISGIENSHMIVENLYMVFENPYMDLENPYQWPAASPTTVPETRVQS